MMKDKVQAAFAAIRADQALMDDTAAYLHKELEKRRHKNKGSVLPKLAGAFAAMAVFSVGAFAYSLYFTADAYVSIDVNPSVELTLNRFDRVIATHAFNGDGERILGEAGLRGKSCGEAAGLIISCMEADGYLSDDTLVSVAVQAPSSEREQQLCSVLQQFIAEQVLSVQAAAEVEVFPVSQEIWGSAHGCNMSPAKYLAIQELLEVDEEATIEAYGDSSIRQIRRRAQECRGAHSFESAGHSSESNSSNGQEHGQGERQGNGHGHRGGH